MSEEHQRTLEQNKCLHKYFGCLADELNAAGYDVQTTIKLPISFTGSYVKELIARPFMKVLFPEIEKDGKFSTTDLNTKQISYLYETMNSAMAEKFGIGLQWPDRFTGGECN